MPIAPASTTSSCPSPRVASGIRRISLNLKRFKKSAINWVPHPSRTLRRVGKREASLADTVKNALYRLVTALKDTWPVTPEIRVTGQNCIGDRYCKGDQYPGWLWIWNLCRGSLENDFSRATSRLNQHGLRSLQGAILQLPPNGLYLVGSKQGIALRRIAPTYPSISGLCAVPSKWLVVLYNSYSPACAAGFVRSSKLATCAEDKGR